jgi:hypothetical protein
MKTTRLITLLVGLATIVLISADASAYYHPTMGRFMQRDPGPGASMRLGTAGPAVVGGFVPRDPANQYADGMSLYQYVASNPVSLKDPFGLYSSKCPDLQEKCNAWFSCGVENAKLGKRLADHAADEAKKRYSGIHNGKADAWRHCYWSCLMRRQLGEKCTRGILKGHEDCGDRDGQPAWERKMDEHNNSIGLAMAIRLGSCSSGCAKALDSGLLKGIW